MNKINQAIGRSNIMQCLNILYLSVILACWSSLFSFCDCAQCMNVPVSPHAKMASRDKFPPFNLGEIVTFRCDDGYGFQNYNPSAKCTKVDDGYSTWKFFGNECKPQCSKFPVFPHAEMIELNGRKPPFHLDEKVSFMCETGYGFGAYKEAFCRLIGGKADWILPEYECTLVDCGVPLNVEDGYRIGDKFTYPSNITFDCNLGFEIEGIPTLTCGEMGRWEPRYYPYCKVLNCPELPDPENGYVKDFSRAYKTVAEYECHGGYHVVGDRHRTCLADKTWGGKEPVCVVNICIGPGLIENGRVYNLKNEYKEGETVIFVCNYEDKRHSSTCMKNGNWSMLPPLCEGEKPVEATSTKITTRLTTTLPPKTTTAPALLQEEEDEFTIPVIVGIAVAGSLLVIGIVSVVIFCFFRRRRLRLVKKAARTDAVFIDELRKLERSHRY